MERRASGEPLDELSTIKRHSSSTEGSTIHLRDAGEGTNFGGTTRVAIATAGHQHCPGEGIGRCKTNHNATSRVNIQQPARNSFTETDRAGSLQNLGNSRKEKDLSHGASDAIVVSCA